MKWKHRAKAWLDKCLDGIVGVTFFGMAILIMLLVILRYFFNSSIPGGNEMLRFAFMYTTFLGAAVLLGRDEHIAIHLATKRLPPAVRRAVAAFGNLAIVALHAYLMVLSFRWIAVAGGNMAEELKFPLRYVQIALPIGCGLAALYALNNAFDALFDRHWGKERPE
jgi:TRAP-type C4-dicarboxylate transport system permease small subunit